MTDDEKNIRMEQLRASLLKDIQLQEQVRETYRKILKRASFILACISIVLFTEMSIVVYFILKPPTASQVTLKYIQAEREQLLKERGYIQDARENIIVMMQELAKQDSIIHAQPK